jgi:magnesium transporter
MSSHHKEQTFKNFTWIDILNPDKGQLTEISTQYQLDFFQIKDSIEVGHLPKIESYPDYTFLILRAFTGSLAERNTNLNKQTNKVAFFVNSNRLITIHKAEFDFFNDAPDSIQHLDDLLIFIIRNMIKTYEDPIQKLSKKVEKIEKTVFMRANSAVSLEDIYYHKAQTRLAKKNIQYAQQVVGQLTVKDKFKPGLQDLKDRLLGLSHSCDEVIDDTNNLVATYLSLNAQNNNEVMKLLTVFSVFFLPLTFIVGVYGMNFENMPELKMKYAYFVILGVMLAIVIWIYFWFKKRKIF